MPKIRSACAYQLEKVLKGSGSMGDVQQGEVFIKLFVGARSGLIAALGAELFTTYAVLATYMDREGICYPSQDLLAANLGIRREAVNKRIKKLKAFEWKGEKLIEEIARRRDEKTQKWSNVVYKLNTNLAFRIFV
jgi:hypothetical protein